MFEIDKSAFGTFLAERRKEKGYTQKELAAKLFISDKAVSKWERALSMPDISLLIPLAEILDVSVTELLEGQKLDSALNMDTEQVEVLVKKALTLSDDNPEKRKARLKKHIAVFGGCSLLALLETVAGIWLTSAADSGGFSSNLLTMEGLSVGLGIYFWFFMKEKLPAYYDENEINSYSDGVFRMNVPSMRFNNSNWPHIICHLRIWAIVTMIIIPFLCLLLSLIPFGFWGSFGIQNAILIGYLSSLFVPVWIAGKKYG